MSRRAILFRFLGSGWLTLGLICLSVGSLQIIAPDRVDWWGKLAASGNIDTSRLVLHLPLLAITLLAWGLMSALLGWNLIRLTSWAQPLAQTSHLLLAVYLATGLTTSLAVSPQVRGYTLVGLSLLVGNLGLAYLLRGRLADEVFSQVPWQTAPVIPMRCEFCGSTLHRGTGRLTGIPRLRASGANGTFCHHVADSPDQADRSLWKQAVETLRKRNISSYLPSAWLDLRLK